MQHDGTHPNSLSGDRWLARHSSPQIFSLIQSGEGLGYGSSPMAWAAGSTARRISGG